MAYRVRPKIKRLFPGRRWSIVRIFKHLLDYGHFRPLSPSKQHLAKTGESARNSNANFKILKSRVGHDERASDRLQS